MDNPLIISDSTIAAIEEKVHELNTQAWGLRKQDAQRAHQLAEESAELSQTLVDNNSDSPVYKQERGKALLVLAISEFRLLGWASALRHAEEALKLFEEIGDDEHRLYCMECIVRAYGTSGLFSEALDLSFRCLDLADDLADNEARGRAMNLLGVLYWHTGDYNRALGWYQQALDLLRESGNRYEMSEVLNNLGLIYTSLGDENKAFEYCLSGLLTKKELGDRLGESHALLNIGNLYMGRNEPDRALAHYLECLYIQEELSDKDGRAHTLTNLSQVYMDLHEEGRAMEYASECLALARDIGNRRVESYALTMFASLCEKQQQFDSAIDFHLQGLSIRRAMGYRQGEITSLLQLGALYTQLKDIDKATLYLMEALSIAEDTGMKNRICEAYEKIAAMYERAGNTREALKYYKLFSTLQRDLFNEQASTQRRNLQVLYEMEQAAKEAEIYRLENTELAAANRAISAQKLELEQQAKSIESFNKELQRKNAALERMSYEKDEFFNIAVHGLNTPISIIMLAVSMIRNRRSNMSDEDIETNLSYIETTLWRMEDTVRKLLRSNVVESAPLQPHLQATSLPLLVEQEVEDYRSRAEQKHIALVVENAPDSLEALVDAGMAREIVDHLLSNAIKFSPPHTTVRITLSEAVVDVDQPRGGQRVARISVSDEGPGITPTDRERLFGRFQRLSAKPTGEEPSLGLGLSIAKKLAESMSGTIRYDASGPGATFVVELLAVQ